MYKILSSPVRNVFLFAILFVSFLNQGICQNSSEESVHQYSSEESVHQYSSEESVHQYSSEESAHQYSSEESVRQSVSPPNHEKQPLLEIKGGYFFFSDPKLRDIYDEGGLDIQISGSYPVWRWLQIYGSMEYMHRWGRSENCDQKTKIWETPLSLGLKPIIQMSKNSQYYLAIGPRYFFVFQHNDSKSIDRKVFHSGVGGFFNTGFNFFPIQHMVIDIFGEYSYKQLHFRSSKANTHGRRIQVGGFCFGAGLGYAF